jgi:hypothetical protein
VFAAFWAYSACPGWKGQAERGLLPLSGRLPEKLPPLLWLVQIMMKFISKDILYKRLEGNELGPGWSAFTSSGPFPLFPSNSNQ